MERPSGTMSTEGELVLPKAIRDRRRWGGGTRFTFEERPEGILIREAPLVRPTTVEEVAGMLAYDGPPVSIEEMNDAIAIGVKERSDRGRY